MSLQCYCQGSCPNGQPNGTCEAPPRAGCFAAAEEVYDPETDSMVAERTYGCLPSEEGGLMMCRGSANCLFAYILFDKIYVLWCIFTGFKAPLNWSIYSFIVNTIVPVIDTKGALQRQFVNNLSPCRKSISTRCAHCYTMLQVWGLL